MATLQPTIVATSIDFNGDDAAWSPGPAYRDTLRLTQMSVGTDRTSCSDNRPSIRGERVNYTNFLKKLDFPNGFVPPTRLAHRDVVATAITRADLIDDVRGINASLELIRKTRGGKWPTGPVTDEENYVDLVWHECEFRDGKSLTYVVRDTAGAYLGCCYLYPLGSRTPLDEHLLTYDVDVSWWVTPDAYNTGRYTQLHEALRTWLSTEFRFWNPHYSNRELDQIT